MAGSNTNRKQSAISLAVKKLPVGRPSKMTAEAVAKLKAAFANSFTVNEACWYAGISKQTYYDWGEKYPELLDQMDAAKNAPNMKAKQIVIGAVNAGDVETSKWWLKNKAGDEFGGSQTAIGVNVNFINVSKGDQGEYGL